MKKLLILLFPIFASVSMMAQQLPPGFPITGKLSNPVLPNVADAGVIRFNGKYYIGGVHTNGSFYISSDLVNWKGPQHVFSMNNRWATGTASGDNQIHANDMIYINGQFHLYWSVNHFGNDKDVRHIGHARSAGILGPYKEPDTLTWLDSRIDPHLFRDDDGKLYLYMVKFTDGNTIWARPMKDPSTFAGDPVYQFASLPATWETMDNRVAEGPYVIKYRDNYYMMYNANHTATSWGNYMLGVAQSKSPTGFNNANKYSYPLLQSNQFELNDLYPDLLQYDSTDGGMFRYTTTEPLSADWFRLNTGNSEWKQGKPGFGAEFIKGSTAKNKKTNWNSEQIWLRREFLYNNVKHGNLSLRLNHSGPTQVWLNGQLIYDTTGSRYMILNLAAGSMAAIREGKNQIAIHSKAGSRPFLDASLFAVKSDTARQIVYSPGQPNIVRGPNGFEWWLVYMADQTDQRRSQYIDRVHFFNRTMYVECITGKDISGFHPLPAAPSAGDIFEDSSFNESRYSLLAGRLTVIDGEARQSGTGAVTALIKQAPATNYLFEAGIKPGAAVAGIFAWYKDAQNNLMIVFNRDRKQLQLITKKNSFTDTRNINLPTDFDFTVYHSIRLCKNDAAVEMEIDGLKLPGANEIRSRLTGTGLPGLYSTAGTTTFDGIVFTRGFDESDTKFAGWHSFDDPGGQGKWIIDSNGITTPSTGSQNRIFKGDRLQNYEFGIQLTSRDTTGTAGIYPVYIDDKNYVQAKLDFASGILLINVMHKGVLQKPLRVSVHQTTPQYSDIKYTDFAENVYSLSSLTKITGLRLPRHPVNNTDTIIDDLYSRIDIAYRSGVNWKPITGLKKTASSHPGFDSLAFDPVYTDGIRFTNKGADNSRYFYKIWLAEKNRLSYNLRARKTGNQLYIFIDGKNLARIEQAFGPSRVGLIAENNVSSFNGALLYELPE